MKIIKKINNKNYNIRLASVPKHKLPEEKRKIQMQKSNENKIDLTDVTFMIPLRLESQDRVKCVTIVINYLLEHFNTNIIVLEEGERSIFPSIRKTEWDSSVKYIFRHSSENLFYKTKNLNIICRETKTNIICSLDSDCLFPIEQYVKTTQKIRDGVLDFCYPFSEPLRNIPKDLLKNLENSLDLSTVSSKVHPKTRLIPPGGCFFMNRQKYIEGGMENEYMISYGPEDTERRDRFLILGYRVGNTLGPIYHIDHDRTHNSNHTNPYFKKNTEEYEKVRFMSRRELTEYIQTWAWIK